MKVLVIRLSSIGDVVLATPILRCLDEQLPNADIYTLTKPQFATILTANPHVMKVIPYSEDSACLAALRKEEFDFIVDLQHNHRSKKVVRQLGVKHSTYPKEDWNRILYVLTKKNFCTGRSVVQRYFEAVKPLGVKNDNKGLEYYYDSTEIETESQNPKTEVSSFIASILNGWHSAPSSSITHHPSPTYAILVCGAQHYTKQIPMQQMLELCRLIQGTIVLIGGKQESLRWQEYLSRHPCELMPRNVQNYCGKTTLSQSTFLIQHSSAVITPDTGMMHIAAACHKPILAVWGNTTPQMGFFPYLTTHTNYQVEGLHCRPCSRFGKKRCPLGHFRCMTRQDWHSIAAQVNTYLATSKHPPLNK